MVGKRSHNDLSLMLVSPGQSVKHVTEGLLSIQRTKGGATARSIGARRSQVKDRLQAIGANAAVAKGAHSVRSVIGCSGDEWAKKA